MEKRREIAKKVVAVFENTSLSLASIAVRLRLPTAYLSMIKNERYLDKIPASAWKILEDLGDKRIDLPLFSGQIVRNGPGDKVIILGRGITGSDLSQAKESRTIQDVGDVRVLNKEIPDLVPEEKPFVEKKKRGRKPKAKVKHTFPEKEEVKDPHAVKEETTDEQFELKRSEILTVMRKIYSLMADHPNIEITYSFHIKIEDIKSKDR